jgi:hypothetical protein
MRNGGTHTLLPRRFSTSNTVSFISDTPSLFSAQLGSPDQATRIIFLGERSPLRAYLAGTKAEPREPILERIAEGNFDDALGEKLREDADIEKLLAGLPK